MMPIVLLLATGTLSGAWAQDAASGRAEFLAHCASCHGIDGKGRPAESTETVRPADLTTLARQTGGAFSSGAVYEMIDGRRAIRSHHSAMPIWGCRYRSEPVPRWKRKRFRGYQQKPLESLLNLTCDSEETIQARIRSVVEYLETIQQR